MLLFSHHVLFCVQCSNWSLSSARHILQQPFVRRAPGETEINVHVIQRGAVDGHSLADVRTFHVFCSSINSLLFSDFQFITWARFRCESAKIEVLSIEKFLQFADFWYFADFSFPALRVFSFCRFAMQLKMWIFKNSQFLKISALRECQKTSRSKRIEESSRTRKLRSVKIMCLRDGVCLFLIFLQLVSLSFALSLSPLLPFSLCRSPFCPSLCHPLLSSCCCRSLGRSGWGASASCRRDLRRPLAPLALNKENFAEWTWELSRHFIHEIKF